MDLRHESVCNFWVTRRIGEVHGTSCEFDGDAERMIVDKRIFIIETMEKLRQVCLNRSYATDRSTGAHMLFEHLIDYRRPRANGSTVLALIVTVTSHGDFVTVTVTLRSPAPPKSPRQNMSALQPLATDIQRIR